MILYPKYTYILLSKPQKLHVHAYGGLVCKIPCKNTNGELILPDKNYRNHLKDLDKRKKCANCVIPLSVRVSSPFTQSLPNHFARYSLNIMSPFSPMGTPCPCNTNVLPAFLLGAHFHPIFRYFNRSMNRQTRFSL